MSRLPDDLEAQLKALRPHAPSPRLRGQVLASMPSAQTTPAEPTRGGKVIFARFAPWLAVAAAVGIVVTYFSMMPGEEAAPVAAETSDTPSPLVVGEPSQVSSPGPVPAEEWESLTRDQGELDETLETAASDHAPMMAAGFRPIRAENALLSRVDDGLVTLEGGMPARRYRYRFLDTITWENPRDGAQVEMAVPREELVLVPVRTF